jgi:hypothetical protein
VPLDSTNKSVFAEILALDPSPAQKAGGSDDNLSSVQLYLTFGVVWFGLLIAGAAIGRNWWLFFFVGLLAQLVDGALGMAFGVTATTVMMSFGTSPAQASAMVHIAEIFTTAGVRCVALVASQHQLGRSRGVSPCPA